MSPSKRTTKPKPVTEAVEAATPSKVRSVTSIRHGALRCAAGAVVDADAEIVARCPGSFEPVEDEQ